VDANLDADLAKIVAYVTFDGHLGKNLGRFYLSSSNDDAIEDFRKLVKKKFGLIPRYEAGMGYGKSTKCIFGSSPVARFLNSIGAPKGNKVLTVFRVPAWIKADDEFSRAYLSVAFQCEGYVHKSRYFNSFDVAFHINKCVDLLDNGIAFVNDLREMLGWLGILTTRIGFHKGNLRKDGKLAKGLIFSVRSRSCGVFKDQVGFGVDAEKNNLLDRAAAVANRPRLCEQDALWLTDRNTLPERWRVALPTEHDADLARFYGYVLKYGNITLDLRQFYITSPHQKLIGDFARIVREKFGLVIPFARKRRHSYTCIACSVKIGRWLNEQGLTHGRERSALSSMPQWITESEENLAAFNAIASQT